jgi:hypothetical protein
MPRRMVGLLGAVAVAMSALVSLVHSDLVWVVVADASVAAGLVAYVTAPAVALLPQKKERQCNASCHFVVTWCANCQNHPARADHAGR